jgi:glycosyltransferase involved in cell wall biosynthesis
MKVYLEVEPASLGRAMYRINKAMKEFAPQSIQFTTSPEDADLQVIHSTDNNVINLIKNNNFVLLQYCIYTEAPPTETWPYFFNKSKLVISYVDLPTLTGDNNFNFYRTPFGVDPKIFYKTDIVKTFTFLSSGYVPWYEAIKEVYDAVTEAKGFMAHLGYNFNYGRGFYHFENLSEDDLRKLYNESFFVSGLRRIEGFEFPVIEGTLCGARGVCFNEEYYTHWYEDFVEYVNSGEPEYVVKQLVDLINKPYRAVTDKEIEYVKDKFSWETIVKNIWKKIEESI